MPGGSSSQRDVAELPGAVAMVPLLDDGTVLLVRQYRHPVARHLLEVPAGLLDTRTESVLQAAERELLEEVGMRAGRWDTLADVLTSPGMSDETIRLLLARDLCPVELSARPPAVHEEADMQVVQMPLTAAVDLVISGELENGISAAALLAAQVAISSGRQLRSADAPWRARKSTQD